MSLSDKNLLIITNLYPVPWAPNRASFNKQQFDFIEEYMSVKIVILLPWIEWIKHRSDIVKSEKIKYCPYFYIPKFGRRLVPFLQSLSLLCLLPWMKKQKACALLASWAFPDAVSASMINKYLRLPFYVKVHGTDVNENTQFLPRSNSMKKWLSKAKAVFCASNALAESLINIGISKEKVLVNYNGVNTHVFYPGSPEGNTSKSIIFVGNLIFTKGVKELIQAFTELQESIPDVTLDIIGDGPLRSFLEKESAELKLPINIHGSLPLTKVAEKIRNSSILVLPSYREGVPNVLLESFASGVPVVATDVGGIPEVVNNNVGILVAPRSVNDLKQGIVEALNTQWDRNEIIEHSNRFKWNNNVKFVLERLEAE